MNEFTRKLGLTVSFVSLAAFVVYTFCFAAILLINPPFIWIDIHHLAAYEAASVRWMKYLGMGCMLLYVCTFSVAALCICEDAGKERHILASCCTFFSGAFCVCVSIAYFVQMTSTRLQLQAGNLDGLLQFTQSYNLSALNGINMLGWTLFYGLATLTLGFLLKKKAKLLPAACFANSALMLAGFIGYLLNHFMTLLLTMNLGLGGAGLLMLIGFVRYFKKQA